MAAIYGMQDKYNTKIPIEKLNEYRRWIQRETEKTGQSPTIHLYNYDIRGFWLSGDWENKRLDPNRNAKWNKPNHPMFSNESKYHGTDEYYGGQWGREGDKLTFTPSPTNINFHGENGLYRHFRENDLGIILEAQSTPSPYPVESDALLNLDGSERSNV